MEETKKRGFAAMSPEKQREIAKLGGKASHGGGRPPKIKLEMPNPAK